MTQKNNIESSEKRVCLEMTAVLMIMDISIVKVDSRRQWSSMFKDLRVKKPVNLELYVTKLIFGCRLKIKASIEFF